MSDESVRSVEQIAVDREMDILDAFADKWAQDCDLLGMIKNISHVINLNKNSPENIRQKFRLRMEAQIDAIIRLAFVEGAYRAITELENQQIAVLKVSAQAERAS
jgi:hypothetical protein